MDLCGWRVQFSWDGQILQDGRQVFQWWWWPVRLVQPTSRTGLDIGNLSWASVSTTHGIWLRWYEWSIPGANSEVPSDVNFVQWIFKRGWSMSLFGDYIIWIHMISPIVGWCLMSMSTFKANYWGYHTSPIWHLPFIYQPPFKDSHWICVVGRRPDRKDPIPRRWSSVVWWVLPASQKGFSLGNSRSHWENPGWTMLNGSPMSFGAILLTQLTHGVTNISAKGSLSARSSVIISQDFRTTKIVLYLPVAYSPPLTSMQCVPFPLAIL